MAAPILMFSLAVSLLLMVGASGAPRPQADWPDPRFILGPLLFEDDFAGSVLPGWTSELEGGGTVAADGGKMVLSVPRGATVWFRAELSGPVLIEYEAIAIRQGGPNDRVSDLNCFWMAQDPAHPDRLLDAPRSGKFSDYDALTTYYVGLGGNGNTTTRFRRYIGKTGDRPLRPQDDLRDPASLLQPNVTQTIRLVVFGGLVQYYRNDQRLFELMDDAPYTHGWFGLRTTASHLEVRHFRVYRLLPPVHPERKPV